MHFISELCQFYFFKDLSDFLPFRESEFTQSCLTLCNPVDCSLSGSSVHGIFQARILGWVAILFFRGSSPPRDWSQVSCIVGRCFTIWATREASSLSLLFSQSYGFSYNLPLTRHDWTTKIMLNFCVPRFLIDFVTNVSHFFCFLPQ